MSSANSNGAADETVRIKLMHSEEVYLYKIPPMASASLGHKAEDWNLANPLQTCSLWVWELPDTNQLQLEFFKQDSKDQLFCQSTINLSDDSNKKLAYFFEQVADSSRYFVLRIQAPNGREALIGFGFRERDEATDLREALQHFERSLLREKEAASIELQTINIPQLAEGEKIHVHVGTAGNRPRKERNKATTNSTGGGLLLKKPPPPASPGTTTTDQETFHDKTLQRTLKVEELDRLKIDDSDKVNLSLPPIADEQDGIDVTNGENNDSKPCENNADDEFTDFQQG